jgi:hypothetical protein
MDFTIEIIYEIKMRMRTSTVMSPMVVWRTTCGTSSSAMADDRDAKSVQGDDEETKLGFRDRARWKGREKGSGLEKGQR